MDRAHRVAPERVLFVRHYFEMATIYAWSHAAQVVDLVAVRDLLASRQLVGDSMRVLHYWLTVRVEDDLTVSAHDIDRTDPE